MAHDQPPKIRRLGRSCNTGRVACRMQPSAWSRFSKTAVAIVMGGTAAIAADAPIAFGQSTAVAWSPKDIQFASYTARGVWSFVQQGTTYMPVWYVLEALRKSGYAVAFDGHTISIHAPAGVSVNTAGLSIGTGNLGVSVNGKTVKFVPSEVRPDPASGKPTQYLPIYYIQQVLDALSFFNTWNGTTWTGKPVTAQMIGDTTVQTGQLDAFALALSNPDGSPFVPMDSVQWSVTGPASASIDPTTGVFSATEPGTYDVTASVDGFRWSEPVHVYGDATGFELSQTSDTLFADGVSQDTITVQAVDAEGNPVPDFTGQVTLNIPQAGGSFLGGIDTGLVNQVPVYIYNGQGTATLTAPSTAPGVSETITETNPVAASQSLSTDFALPSLNVRYLTPVVSQIGMTPGSTTLDASDGWTTTLQVELDDAAGNPVQNGSYGGMPVTFSLSGPGSFGDGYSETTLTEYVYPGTGGVQIPVYANPDASGPIVVSASGEGVSGQVSLTDHAGTSADQLTVANTPGILTQPLAVGGVTLPAGTPFTLYTVTVADSSGNALPQSDTLWVTSGTGAVSNDGIYLYSVAGGQPSSLLPVVGTGTSSLTTSADTGKAQFIVIAAGTPSPGTTLNVRDLGTNATVSIPIPGN